MRRISGSATVAAATGGAAERALRTLVLWGERGSGKAGIVGALRSEAAKTVGERWCVDLADAQQEVADFAESASLALRLRDVKETTVRRPDHAVTLVAKRMAGARAQEALQLNVLDPRGTLADRVLSPDARDAMHALATGDGIIWLIETPQPTQPPRNQERLLHQIVSALEAGDVAQLDVPVAVVLTKIDRLSQTEMRRALNAPEETLRAQLGDAAFGWLVAACPQLRCFALSAAGTVRNAARPVGLSVVLDWFSAEWRRGEREIEMVKARERRSARVARVRRRVPLAAVAVAVTATVVFAGAAAARRLMQRPTIWSSSSGGLAAEAPGSATISPTTVTAAATRREEPTVSLAGVVAANARGDSPAALRMLSGLELAPSDTTWFAADSLLAIVALHGADSAIRATPPDTGLLRIVVSTTSAAIERAHPGTFVLASLSVARAEACIVGRLDCPAERLREDLAWALLLGTPAEQDAARRLRAAWLADAGASGS